MLSRIAQGPHMRRFSALFAVPLLFPPLATSDGPAKTGEFLAWCRLHNGACSDRIAGVENSLVADQDKRFCAPADGNVTAGVAKVQAWLAAHPETSTLSTDVAITNAWIALYPCNS